MSLHSCGKVFPFLHISSVFIIYVIFDDGQSDWCEGEISHFLSLIVSLTTCSTFPCLLAISVSAGKCVWVFSHLLIRLFVFVCMYLILVYLNRLHRLFIANVFSPFWGCLSLLLFSFLLSISTKIIRKIIALCFYFPSLGEMDYRRSFWVTS